MRYILCILLVFTSIIVTGQQPVMKDGKVYNGNNVYCDYTESGYKISTIDFQGASNDAFNPINNPEASKDSFKNVTISKDGRTFVIATAKVYASIHEKFLVYYYNIRFEPLEQEINIKYHPMLIRLLLQDMVNYDVINGSFLNEKNAQNLLDKWSQKTAALGSNYLNKGISNNYNSATQHVADKKGSIDIRIEGDKIYRNDTLMGTYRQEISLFIGGWRGNKNDYVYLIDDPTGKLMAKVTLPTLRSIYILQPAGEKEQLKIVTTDRDEKRIISSAAKVLTVHNAQKKI
jgi:hypothetical protein